MASPAITTRPLTSVELAHAAAVAIPSEISTRPLVGIIGVLIGAGHVPLTGRILCNVHRWCSQRRAITLWVVSRPTFLALDVLGLRSHRAGDDDLYLFRNTVASCS